MTYSDFKTRFLSWYRGYSLSLYSADPQEILDVVRTIRADPAQYKEQLQWFVDQAQSSDIYDTLKARIPDLPYSREQVQTGFDAFVLQVQGLDLSQVDKAALYEELQIRYVNLVISR